MFFKRKFYLLFAFVLMLFSLTSCKLFISEPIIVLEDITNVQTYNTKSKLGTTITNNKTISNTQKIRATLKDSNGNETLNWSLAWKEVNSWSRYKSVSNYVTLTKNDNYNVTLTYKQNFDCQIILRCEIVNGSSFDEVVIDCYNRFNGSYSFVSADFSNLDGDRSLSSQFSNDILNIRDVYEELNYDFNLFIEDIVFDFNINGTYSSGYTYDYSFNYWLSEDFVDSFVRLSEYYCDYGYQLNCGCFFDNSEYVSLFDICEHALDCNEGESWFQDLDYVLDEAISSCGCLYNATYIGNIYYYGTLYQTIYFYFNIYI